MELLTNVIRCAHKSASSILLLAGAFTLANAPGYASNPSPEKIQATYTQDGNLISVALTVYNYSTPSDLQLLSQAFQDGQDRGLAAALSKIKAVGQCTITGAPSYDVAFIQMVRTPTGRRITFITSRPHLLDGGDPHAPPQSFDLAVGQFDLNDAEPAKSTGFLFPASKLVVDKMGELRYDLASSPLTFVNVLDSHGSAAELSARN